jgi:hypothetical protein
MLRVRTRRWLLVPSAANPGRTAKNCLTSARLGTRHCSIRVSEDFGNLSDLIHPLHLNLSLGCVKIDVDWTWYSAKGTALALGLLSLRGLSNNRRKGSSVFQSCYGEKRRVH